MRTSRLRLLAVSRRLVSVYGRVRALAISTSDIDILGHGLCHAEDSACLGSCLRWVRMRASHNTLHEHTRVEDIWPSDVGDSGEFVWQSKEVGEGSNRKDVRVKEYYFRILG